VVKRITITVDDEVYEEWLRLKGSKSWFKFFKEAIERLEETESVPLETVCKNVKRLCECLSEVATECPREGAILRFCAEKHDTNDLTRILIMIMAHLEANQKGVDKWLMSLAKVLILDIVSGDMDDVQRVLREICSISSPSR